MLAATGLVAATAAFNTATAADLGVRPVYKGPVAVIDGGWYAWVDGEYDRVRLPAYGLGIRAIGGTIAAGVFPDAGPVQGFDPRLNGGGVRGAVGYRMPGSTVRLEAGASYVTADGTSSGGAATNLIGMQFLNGGVPANAYNCTGAGFVCSVNGSLASSYHSWQVNGKAMVDWNLGLVKLTPSAALFGGEALRPL